MQARSIKAWFGATGLIMIAVAFTGACLPNAPSSSKNPQELLSARATQAAQMAPPTATAFVIEYVVSGDTTSDAHHVDIRWGSADSRDAQTNVNVSGRVWSRFITVKPGSALYLEAVNNLAGDVRTVRCQIFLSGRLWAENEAADGGAPATCNAIAGW